MKLVLAKRPEKAASQRAWTQMVLVALLLALTCALAGCGKDAAENAEGQDGAATTEQAAENNDAEQKDSQDAAAEDAQGTEKDSGTDASKEENEKSADDGTSSEAVKMSDIVGTWVLYEVQAKDEAMSLSPDEVELYANGGYKISLKLTVEGKAKLSRYGQVYEGTWEFKTDTSGSLALTEVISDTGVIDPAQAEKEAQGPATLNTDFKYVEGKLQLTGPNKEIEVLVLAD